MGLAEYLRVEKEITTEFPNFDVVPKRNSLLMKVANVLLIIITFGQMRTFMTRFTTQVMGKIYVPDDWTSRPPLERAVTLRHERVHLRQRVRYGNLMFTLRYAWWPLPLLFALGRRDLEQEAYEESMRAVAEYYGVNVIYSPAYKENMLGNFTSASYFWMFPFKKKLEAWFESTANKIREGLTTP